MTSLLQICALSKAFAAPVLSGIDLSIESGEVVALTGENGAGKSTLSRIIAGLHDADAGEMKLLDTAFAPRSRAEAERLGVRMVLQELSLVATLSVAENLCLGQRPQRLGFIDRQTLETKARQALARVGLNSLDVSRPISELGIGQQQLVEIARGLSGEIRLLILDEPTAMLTAREVEELFRQIDLLRQRGVAILYISHRLDEVQRIADRIVVLRDGRLVENASARDLTHDAIVRAMVGRDFAALDRGQRPLAGRERMRCEGMRRLPLLKDASLALRAGEIVGVAGLVGSGRTELLRVLFGADRADAGRVFINGCEVQFDSPAAAVRHGIGLLTEDRKSQGLLRGHGLRMNVTMAALRTISVRGWIDRAKDAAVADHWSQRLHIRRRDREQNVDELSGGNQQKVLLARWLHRDCDILMLDEPTRGVDIGARAEIHAELDALARAGKSLLVVSSDLRELMALCDRIAVMSDGTLVRSFERGEWSEETLLAAAFSAHAAEQVRAS